MNIKNLIFFSFFALLLTGCWEKVPENTTGTWTSTNTWTIAASEQTQDATSGEITTWLNQLTENLKINPQLANNSDAYFPVSTCNKIIDLYNCIISKAPIENQSVMQKALTESTQSWQLMPDNQLRKTCEEITMQEEFIRVKEHYTWSGQNLGCHF